ncbi:MAG: hypothetical protein HYU63_00615 [Armatimonadetes bacterium]|nr:hypothetical protein [Armatimonadota bacterium]
MMENQHDFMNYSLNLTFLVNKNAQLIAEYRYNPLNIVYFDVNQPLDLGRVFSVQLKQSFGGSFEKVIERKWNGKIIIKMLYKSANENDKKVYDLKKARVSIDGENFSETNDEGEAYFEDISPGKHKIKVYLKEIGANFVPLGKTNLEINLMPSETKEISFLFKAYSSIYAIVWNDVDNSHKIPQAYFGFSNLKIDLIAPDNRITNMLSGDDGTAYFKKIIPGRYKITVWKDSIPEGMVPTTPLSLDLELSPGDEKVIGFGIKGYGEISGKVSLVRIGSQNVFEPFSDIKIKMDGIAIGASDEKGEFLITVPAGGHIFEPGYSVEYYLIDEKTEKIMILPAKKAFQEYKLVKYGKIIGKINFKENVSLKQFSKESIVIILKGAQGEEEFVYTDKNGLFIFNNLKMGKYKVILDKSYIPEGLKSSSPLINEVVINSGDIIKVNYIFDLK